MPSFSRRDFVKSSALAAAAAQLPAALRAQPAAPAASAAATARSAAPVRWLDGAPTTTAGATWGVPWPRGAHPSATTFALRDAAGAAVPVQTWPLATWPDGSLKWTAHSIPADTARAEQLTLVPGAAPTAPATPLRATETADAITIDTGVIRATVAKRGQVLVTALERDGRVIARDGRLVLLKQNSPDSAAGEPGATPVATEAFQGELTQVTLEQAGPVRAVVKLEGKHRALPTTPVAGAAPGASAAAGRAWLPFVVRLYFHAGSDAVRLLHTIVFDGDEATDFIRGLGVRFTVPLAGELHDRHVRFSGEDGGLFAEAVRGLTGLRRDPGAEVKQAQLDGRATPPASTFPPAVGNRLRYIPAFGDWTLFQPTADSFAVRKRTSPGHTWLDSAHGRRASGLGYVGTPQGGVAFGIRNFWQSHPAQLDVRGAAGDAAEITAWVWAPEARAMDLRFYHDGMGQDDYVKQIEGLEITYEDYEPGFGTAQGVARTSELFFFAVPATPPRARLVELAALVATPPQLTATPEWLQAAGVFGGLFRLPDRSTPAKAEIEDQLDFYFSYYVGQRDQRRWYGYWNYGDVMHTYDPDRHEWRYDVGGFAWDNSELSTDIWLWLAFLRSGRADIFRFAEAMTRHTGEVDVHHLGRFAPLGSRHNVLHWGCSAKQLRISTAQNRRYYYYLTADERTGDLMREQLEAARALVAIPPGRKLGATNQPGDLDRPKDNADGFAGLGFGTDWGSAASAWLTEWERTGDAKMRTRLENGLRTIGAQPKGFYSAGSSMNLETGEFRINPSDRPRASHLSAVFGLLEVCAELVTLFDVPEFNRAWLDYCELYNASGEEQARRLGSALGRLNLQQGHSRLTAFFAQQTKNPEAAARAWREFYGGDGGIPRGRPLQTVRVAGPLAISPVEEAAGVSTNGVAQWGLAAIQCLALIGDQLPDTPPAPRERRRP